jgi:hypothetical protein
MAAFVGLIFLLVLLFLILVVMVDDSIKQAIVFTRGLCIRFYT